MLVFSEFILKSPLKEPAHFAVKQAFFYTVSTVSPFGSNFVDFFASQLIKVSTGYATFRPMRIRSGPSPRQSKFARFPGVRIPPENLPISERATIADGHAFFINKKCAFKSIISLLVIYFVFVRV
jgi:hypothetical protein